MKKKWNQWKQLKRSVIKKYCRILLFGILFSYVITNLLLSNTISVDRILSVGQVNEFRESSLTSSNSTWVYDAEQELYTIVSNDATKRYGKWQQEVQWKCLYLKLDKLSTSSVDWVLKQYDANNNFVGQQIITVQNGENWIALNTGEAFRKFSIQILGAEGLQFQIKEMILTEEIPQKKQGIVLFCVILLLILFVSSVLERKYAERFAEINCERIGEPLQFCYTLVGNSDLGSVGKIWTREKKNRIRTVLFLVLFSYMLIMYNCNLYLGTKQYRYHALIGGTILFIIACISKEKELAPIKWNSATARWWYTFWIIACISDFVVSKRLKFTGWAMLFVGGLFFLVWQHMKHPDDILWNMLHAVEILAAGGMIYNMIFRLKYDGLLYNGYMKSASDFGVFSAFLCLIFLVEIYECYQKQEFGKKLAFYACGAAVSVLQVLLSGKEIAVVFTGAMSGIALIVILKKMQKITNADKKQMLKVGILAVAVVCIYYLSIKNIPWHLGTMIQYEKEQFETAKDPSVIAILAQSGIPAYQNVKFHSINERVIIWKSYLREMNLFGHAKPDLYIWNKAWNAQNNILQILYRYGIFAVLPYIMLFASAGKRAVENCRNHWKNLKSIDVLYVGVFVFWGVVGFFGNVEYPYYQPIWLFVYLMLGRYLTDEGEHSVSS